VLTTILVTGAGRGIGYELAKQAMSFGWTVYGSVRSRNSGYKLRADLPDIKVLQFDVTDHDAIEAAANEVSQLTFDIVINNAGVIGPEKQSALEMDFEGFRETLNVNVLGPLKIAQAFLPNLRMADNPRLVTISSQMAAMDSFKSNQIAYRASKVAVNKVVQCLASDLIDDGICSVAIDPGWVKTDMGGEYADISTEECAAGVLEVTRNLSIQDTGRFIRWDGSQRNW